MMIPLEKHREVISGGVTDSAAFDISYDDRAHIMGILRDTLYTDKVLAVLREYSTNAWDAHRMSGKEDLPIEVHLPTWEEPYLAIQDFGPGLSHEAVFQVYTQYGASTKRASNDVVGMLGIGSKSGFAYSDSFTIISRHEGKKRTYAAVLDESELGAINLLDEEDCPEDETGVTIQIPVQVSDISEFTIKAAKLYQYFEPMPKFNRKLEFPERTTQIRTKNGALYSRDRNNEWTAVMGCVPYRIDLNQLRAADGSLPIPSGIVDYSGSLFFDIGEIQVNASREELKYSKFTNEALVKKIQALLEDFLRSVLEEEDVTDWQRRSNALILKQLGTKFPEEHEFWADSSIHFDASQWNHFTLRDSEGIPTNMIRLNVGRNLLDTQLYLYDVDDDPRNIYISYGLRYLVTPKKSRPWSAEDWEKAEEELQEFFTEAKIAGIPLGKVSNLAKKSSGRVSRRTSEYNPKYSKRLFEYNGTARNDKYSDSWDLSEATPTKDSPYVILENFIPTNLNHYVLRSVWQALKTVADTAGLPVPTLYGYRSTLRHPVKEEDVVGVPFQQWIPTWLAQIDHPEARQFIHLAGIQDTPAFERWRSTKTQKLVADTFQASLGSDHPLARILTVTQEAMALLQDPNNSRKVDMYDRLSHYIKNPLAEEYLQIKDRYPLIVDCGKLWDLNMYRHYLQYVRIMDKLREESDYE